jgi:hypothetical protein
MTFPALTGNETLLVQGVDGQGRPSGAQELTTTQSIANLGGGGGGGGGGTSYVGRKATTTPVTMINSDGIVNVQLTVPADCTVYGASARTPYQTYILKDSAGTAFAYPITYYPHTGTIDGQASIMIQQSYDSLTIYSDGTNEFTM